jgi:predicted dehydrogenase
VVALTVGDSNPQATPSVNPQIGMVKPPVTSEEPLRAELRAFLDAVRRRSAPVVTLEDGRRALALALNIVTDIHQHGSRIKLEKLTRS